MDDRVELSVSEIERQRVLMQRVYEVTGVCRVQPLAYVDTYGCQQNEADSEKLRGMLIEMGYGITYDENEADIAIVNTCAIRENAENRVLGNVGALTHTKKANPKQLIIFCGCLAGVPETVDKVRNSYHHVRLVFPPSKIWKFPELLLRALTEKKRVFETDTVETMIAEGLPTHRDGTVKAWLPIMHGCNNFCSYCIVPHVRGRERSRRPEMILKEARELVDAGYKDITLLGQNVNSYKAHRSQGVCSVIGQADGTAAARCDDSGTVQGGNVVTAHMSGADDFAWLIREINDIEGDFLIRFMTSHPKDASIELFRALSESEKAARHIHLPFQAGSDRILKLMNRGYTREGYLKKIATARELMPDIVITSDVIVGYPGETETDFDDTLELVEKAQFDAMFTFIYSKRPGTPAAKLPDSVSREEKQTRFERLVKLQNEISERKHDAYVGEVMRVLVDGAAHDEVYPLKARTNGGRLVHLIGEESLVGQFIDARITHSNNWSLFGEPLLEICR